MQAIAKKQFRLAAQDLLEKHPCGTTTNVPDDVMVISILPASIAPRLSTAPLGCDD
jgi:hypothetical protein